jgi:hypothetical protein
MSSSRAHSAELLPEGKRPLLRVMSMMARPSAAIAAAIKRTMRAGQGFGRLKP